MVEIVIFTTTISDTRR